MTSLPLVDSIDLSWKIEPQFHIQDTNLPHMRVDVSNRLYWDSTILRWNFVEPKRGKR